MSTLTAHPAETSARMRIHRKQKELRALSDLVWDIEDRLAQVRAARASLMTSLQEDLRGQASQEAGRAAGAGAGAPARR